MRLRILYFVSFIALSAKLFPQGAPACPSITPVATPASVCQGQCSSLTSTVVSNNQTTAYSVASVAYSPYPYSGGTAVSVNTDDVWSPVINLGFTFCYFGNAYTQAVIGSNGQLTFDLSYANGYDSYPCTANLPSTANMPGNTICAVFRDIDPSVSGTCKYYTTGTAPCRALVIYWSDIALFSCGTPHSTFQLVLYENTNYIDVYVTNSSGTCSWESGHGIIGIQNAAANVAVCPPGRNNSAWSATNEGWRFSPTGAASYSVTWTGPSGVVGTGLGPISVCPTTNTTYTSSMTITDCNGSNTTYTNTVAVTVTPGPTVSVNSGTICAGNSTTLNASGATTSYSWSPSTGLSATTGASVSANPSSTTTYTVTGTSGSCVSTATALVTVNPLPTVTVNSATICPGSSATLTANGANTYAWSPSGTLSSSTGSVVTASPGSTTTYTVTGTSVAGCTATATSIVTIGSAITPSVASASVCSGGSTTLNATGATSYTWSPSASLSASTGSSVTASPGSTTTYTITGATGACTGTTTAVVTVNPLPTVTVNSPSICIGSSATLNASGANTYTWSPGTGLNTTSGGTVTANPTSTTVYTINASSAAGCTTTATSTVTVNPTPTVSVNSITICPGSTGTLTASGANTYTWSPSGSLSSSTGATVAASPSATTVYTITASSAAGCTTTATSTVTIGGSIVASANSATICAGTPATLVASGGSTYTWSPGTGLSSTTAATVTANPPATTTYTLTAASGGCTGTTTAMVTVNPLPTVTVNSSTICIGNSTTLSANGASTYSWSPGTGLSSTTGASVTANPTVSTTYTITGTSAAGCTATATSTVTVNPLPTLSVNNGFVCNGNSTTLTASGASTYTWSPATGLSGTTGASVTASPSATTQYTITATDVNGCVNSDTTSVTVVSNPIITVPPATICAGSSTTLTATGATTYVWSPGTGLNSTNGTSVVADPTTTSVYTITGTAGTCTAVTTTTVNVNQLPPVVASSNGPKCVNQSLSLSATGGISYSWSGPNGFSTTNQNPSIPSVTLADGGIYTVTATDANGCVNADTANVIINPLPVVIATGATVCVGATIVLNVNNSGVTYSWNGPNAFFSSQQNPSITGATVNMSGSYGVTATDANGCYSGNTANVVVNPSLSITAGGDPQVCENGTLHLTADNGVSWSWSGPAGFTSTAQNPVVSFVQLSANGTYTVVGTDANGCQGSSSVSVIINPLPTISANADTICVTQQTAVLTASGAITYTWSPSASLNTSTGTTVNADPLGTTTYTIIGTDGNGCVNIGTTNVMVNQLPNVAASSGVICIGNSVPLVASGAVTYTWTPSTGLSSSNGSSVTANPTSSTGYTITGTDANGCYSTGTSSVTVNPLPIVVVNSGAICSGKSMTLTASGASTYVWSPGAGLSSASGASVSASPASTGSYVVTGTDANGCINTAVALVTVNPLPVPVVSPKVSSACAPVCVTLTNTASVAGTGSWSMGDGTTFSGSSIYHCYPTQGTYKAVLTFTDANGCVGTDSAKIIVYPVPQADFNYSPEPTTIFDPTIYFTDATSGATISNWNWSLGDPSNSTTTAQNTSFTYLEAGSYPVTLAVSSDHGCKDTVTKIVVIAEDFMVYVPNAFSPNGDGVNDSFGAKGEGIKSFKMYIFDRWGNQVYYSENIDKWWDGSLQSKSDNILQQDVFVWKIELKTFKNESRLLKGTVTLIK